MRELCRVWHRQECCERTPEVWWHDYSTSRIRPFGLHCYHLPYTNTWLLLYKFEAINKTEVALYVSFFGSFCWSYKECCSYFAPRRRVGLLSQLLHLVFVAALYVLPRKMPEFRWALDIISLCIYRSSFLFWNLTLSFDCRLAVNFSWIQRFTVTRKETLFDNCSSINRRENEMRSFDKSRRGKPLWHVLTWTNQLETLEYYFLLKWSETANCCSSF